MSITYHVSCMDCNSGIHLGKIVRTHYGEIDIEALGVLGYERDGKWHPQEGTCMILDHFLVLHRGHELRVMPEVAARGDFPRELIFDDDGEEFLHRDVGCIDPHNEVANYPAELLDRLEMLKAPPAS